MPSALLDARQVNSLIRRRLVLVGVLLVAIVAGLIVGMNHFSHPTIDYPAGHPGPDVVVTIPTGASGSDVAHILVQNKVVMTWQSFFAVAAGDPRSVKIQPGAHRVSTHVPARLALDQLLDRSRMVGLVNVTEGMRATDIFKLLIRAGWSEKELKSAFAAAVSPTGFKSPSAEGYLFPASYSFAPGVSAAKVFQTMMDRFQAEATSINLSGLADSLRLTPEQIVTIASLAQAEGGPSDFAKIVRVVLNRLSDGMKLQLDSTVMYALQVSGRIKVTNKDLQVASKYNTYLNAGLPPGPIGNPGRQALLAALNPATGPWLYFVTVKPGETRFTASESEFFKWKLEYERNYAAGAFNLSGSKP